MGAKQMRVLAVMLRLTLLGNGVVGLAGEVSEPAKGMLHAYISLRTDGLSAAGLEAFQRSLAGVKEKEAVTIGSTLHSLGCSAMGNFQPYLVLYKSLTTTEPGSPYLQYLSSNAVVGKCTSCGGSGQLPVACPGCAGIGQMSGAQNKFACPKCSGSGRVYNGCTNCRGQGQTLSQTKMRQSYETLLLDAEAKFVQLYGDLAKCLSKEDLARLDECATQKLLNSISYNVQLTFHQVLNDGSLAYITESTPQLDGAEYGSRHVHVFVKNLGRGFADHEQWGGTLFLIGTYRYATVGQSSKTVKMFTASREEAIKWTKGRESEGGGSEEKSPRSGAKGNDSDPDGEGGSQGTGWLTEGGYVVTCFHVVRGHKSFSIKSRSLPNTPAKLLVKDKANDVAILKIESAGRLPPGLPLALKQACYDPEMN